VPTDAISWGDVRPYLDGSRVPPDGFDAGELERLEEFRTLLAAERTYLDVALALRQREQPSFEAVYFEGTDTAAHLFMSYRPRSSRCRREGIRIVPFRRGPDYENADQMLGRLLAGREGWTVIVLATTASLRRLASAHDRLPDRARRGGRLAQALRSARDHGPGVKRGMRLEEASVYDVAPTVLALFHQPVPRSWPGRVLGAALTPETLARESRALQRRGSGAARSPNAEPRDDHESRELRAKLQSWDISPRATSVPMTTKNNRARFCSRGEVRRSGVRLSRGAGRRADQPDPHGQSGNRAAVRGRPARSPGVVREGL
jgi:hypothetical protein